MLKIRTILRSCSPYQCPAQNNILCLLEDCVSLLVESENSEKLKDSIRHVVDHPEESAERAAQCFAYVQENDAKASKGKILGVASSVARGG